MSVVHSVPQVWNGLASNFLSSVTCRSLIIFTLVGTTGTLPSNSVFTGNCLQSDTPPAVRIISSIASRKQHNGKWTKLIENR